MSLPRSRAFTYQLPFGAIALLAILAVLLWSVINRARTHRAIPELQRLKASIVRMSGRPLGGSIDVGVKLSGQHIDDGALEKAVGLIRTSGIACRTLQLVDTRITDDGLSELKRLKHLTNLTLDQSLVIGHGFRHIKHLDDLTKFTLSMDPKGHPRVADLADLPHIKWLTLRIPDSQLDKVPSLSFPSLCIMGDDITDEGLAHIAGLDNLRGLYLEGCPITDHGLFFCRDAFTAGIPDA